MNRRHFRSLIDINTQEFMRIIQKAIEYKEFDKKDVIPKKYDNKTLAMIFRKNSTRTRVSFETAMFKLISVINRIDNIDIFLIMLISIIISTLASRF